MEVTFSLEAFSKIILHVTKYPQYSVNGILLRRSEKSKKSAKASSNAADGVSSADSKVNNGADAETTSTTTKQVQALKYSFTDAIPCLHMNKYVTPMMELALAQVRLLFDITILKVVPPWKWKLMRAVLLYANRLSGIVKLRITKSQDTIKLIRTLMTIRKYILRSIEYLNWEINLGFNSWSIVLSAFLNIYRPDFVAQRIAEKLGEINPGLLVVMVSVTCSFAVVFKG